ncbi:V-type ATPase subunit [Streptacidiphilus sp. ASG 303]|uniref:V-type ATPase subunit n=1 Tax=Streptacidiphilus sp. ASG 303 TaxID=2896847 RepID=UPI001E5ECABB|nr:V-type ATPase subunit [Streptacidiphilus sp. ASG 303]MCD0484518.1 V-type ATPase subunit [Streptacidiphilus sp. ASG 303]
MTAAWAAGAARARAVASRRAGAPLARTLAAQRTLPDALRLLAATPYRRGLDPHAPPAAAERALHATLLWNLRVLAGWQPPAGAAMLRLLASGFEIANIEGHLRTLTAAGPPGTPAPGPADVPGPPGVRPPTVPAPAGPPRGSPPAAPPAPGAPPPYRLGALATAWPRLARTRTPAGLRAALAASPWGDPGGDTPAAVALWLRTDAAVRTAAAVPAAAPWAAGRLALLTAREVHLHGRPLPEPAARHAAGLLGRAAPRAATLADCRGLLPGPARWALDGVDAPAGLWRAEARWWARLERDGLALLRTRRPGPPPVVGAAAVLAADAWRVRAALQCAARGGVRTDAAGVPGLPGGRDVLDVLDAVDAPVRRGAPGRAGATEAPGAAA